MLAEDRIKRERAQRRAETRGRREWTNVEAGVTVVVVERKCSKTSLSKVRAEVPHRLSVAGAAGKMNSARGQRVRTRDETHLRTIGLGNPVLPLE